MAALTPVGLFAPAHYLSSAQTPSLQLQPSESVSCMINQPQVTFMPAYHPPVTLPSITQSSNTSQTMCLMTTPNRSYNAPVTLPSITQSSNQCQITSLMTTPNRSYNAPVTLPLITQSSNQCQITSLMTTPNRSYNVPVTLPSITQLSNQSQTTCYPFQPTPCYLPSVCYQTSVLNTLCQPVQMSTSSIHSQSWLYNEMFPQCVPLFSLSLPLFLVASSTPTSLNSEELPSSLAVHHIAELYCKNSMVNLRPDQKLLVLSKLFCEVMQDEHNVNLSSDLLKLAAAGMVHLKDCNRSNVIFISTGSWINEG